jgi:hypothetical protein
MGVIITDHIIIEDIITIRDVDIMSAITTTVVDIIEVSIIEVEDEVATLIEVDSLPDITEIEDKR